MTDLRAENFVKTHADITNMENVLLAASMEDLAKQLISTRAKRTIREHTVLTSAMVDKRPDGQIGQDLKIIFVADSGLRVATEGSLMDNASFGSSAKARLKKTKKVVVGTFVSANTMEVHL
jgi:flagella basal body P-ring formation protein FlgA